MVYLLLHLLVLLHLTTGSDIIIKPSDFSENILQFKHKESTIICYNYGEDYNITEADEEWTIIQEPTGPPPPVQVITENFEADVIVVLDASGSVGRHGFSKEIDFLVQVIKALPFGPKGVRIGVVIFNHKGRFVFGVTEYFNVDEIKKALESKTVSFTQSYIDRALDVIVTKDMFGKSGEDRDKVVLIVTDGVSTDKFKTFQMVKQLKEKKVKVLTLAIGNEVSEEEILHISEPHQVIRTFSFNTLDHTINIVIDVLRGLTTAVEINTIVIIFNYAEEEHLTDFKWKVSVIGSLIQQYWEEEESNKFIIIGYTKKIAKLFDVRKLTSVVSITNVLNSKHTSHTNNLSEMFVELKKLGCVKKRPCIVQFIIDNTPDFDDTAIKEFIKNGNIITAIVVGQLVDSTEIYQWAETPNDVLQITSFNSTTTHGTEIKRVEEPPPIYTNSTIPPIVIFIVDFVGKERDDEYTMIIKFIIDAMKKHKLGYAGVRFAVVLIVNGQVRLFDTRHLADIVALQTTLSDGSKYVVLKTLKEFFQNLKEWKCNTKKSCVIVYISNGKKTNPGEVKTEIKTWKEIGNALIVVIIGDQGDTSIIKDWDVDQEDVVVVENVNMLWSSQVTIIEFIAEGITAIQNPQSGKSCSKHTMLDIIFVIDASASICVHVWHKQLKFFSQLVRQFSLGQRSTRVGAMTYSVTASKVFDLDDHSNADDMEKALQKAKLGHGLSNSHMALERILKHDMFGTKAGGRADAQDYVVFLTDGHSTQHEKTREAVEKMKKAGTRFVFVGIGYDISYELLETLTHRPGDIILLNSVKDNAWFPQKFLASNLCTVSKKKKKS